MQTAWARANNACERFTSRLGPFGLAVLMLLGVLVLQSTIFADNAEAGAPFSNGITRSLDHVREAGFQGNWSAKAPTCVVNATANQFTWNMIQINADGDLNTNIINAGIDNTCEANRMFVVYNLTFPWNVNATNIATVFGVDAATSCTPGFYLWALDSAGTILGNATISCNVSPFATKAYTFLNGTFNNIRSLNWVHNGAAGTGANQDYYLFETHLWDTRNATYPVHFAYADYLANKGTISFLRSERTGAQSPWHFESADFQVPSGVGLYYSSMVIRAPCAQSNNVESSVDGTRCYHFMNPTSDTVTFKLLGTSYTHGNTATSRRAFSVWEYNNPATGNRAAHLRNVSMSQDAASCDDSSGNPCLRYTTWYNQEGTMFGFCQLANVSNCHWSASTSTTPFGNATCPLGGVPPGSGSQPGGTRFCGSVTGGHNFYHGFGYRNNTGPHTSLSFGEAGWADVENEVMDVGNITTTAFAPALNTNVFTVTLDATAGHYSTLGNTLVLNMWAYGDNGRYCVANGTSNFERGLSRIFHGLLGGGFVTCTVTQSNNSICPASDDRSAIVVNGNKVDVAYNTFTFDRSQITESTPNGQVVLGCLWILDDFTRANGLNLTAFGNNPWFDNNVTGRSYEILLPPELTGVQWRTVTSIDGRHSVRTACDGTLGLCFGNFLTEGFPVPGILQPVTWRWNVTDFDTGLPLPDVKVFEALQSVGGLTNANGFLNITTSTTDVRWGLTKQGYNAYEQTVERLSVSLVYFNVSMTRSTSRPFMNTTCTLGEDSLICRALPTGNAALGCEELNGNDGTCNKGPIFGTGLKVFQFGCPRDISTSTTKFINNVTVHEAVSAQSFSIALSTNQTLSNSLECLAGETTSIQNSDVEFQFTKPGYQTIEFNADWLERTVIHITPLFKTGTGSASITVTVQNTTIEQGGVAKPASIIILATQGAAEANILDSNTRSKPGLDELLVSLGSDVVGTSTTSKALWGFAIFVVMVLGVVAVYFALTQQPPSGTFVGAVMVPAFFVVAFLGLWETWVVIVGILGVVGILVLALKAGPTGGV